MSGTREQEQTRTADEVRLPRPCRVLMHNDHYTTMDFVVQVLQEIFRKPRREAVRTMLEIHTAGVGVAGVYPAEIAETKIAEVHARARGAGFPLRCSMEPE